MLQRASCHAMAVHGHRDEPRGGWLAWYVRFMGPGGRHLGTVCWAGLDLVWLLAWLSVFSPCLSYSSAPKTNLGVSHKQHGRFTGPFLTLPLLRDWGGGGDRELPWRVTYSIIVTLSSLTATDVSGSLGDGSSLHLQSLYLAKEWGCSSILPPPPPPN